MNKIFLRALEIGDLDYTYKWHSDQTLYSSLAGPFRYVSFGAEREWLLIKEKFSNQEINLMICLMDTSRPIGMLSLREIDWVTRKAHFTGLLIGDPEFRGKGIGTEALDLLLAHCFFDLGLNRIYGNVMEENIPSIKMMEKCGFVKEGKLLQHAFKDGEFKDVFIFGILSEQYFLKRK